MVLTETRPIEFEHAADYRHEIMARVDRVRFLEVPERRYLMIDGTDAPGSPSYTDAIGALYPVAYTLHFALKQRGVNAPVGTLEGLYTLDPRGATNPGTPVEWSWTLMLPVPDEATHGEVTTAIADVAAKLGDDSVKDLRCEAWEEGRVGQLMHIGPYHEEQPTADRLHDAIGEAGLRPHGRHHEVYVSDPNRTAPERLKTVIRQPVEVLVGGAGPGAGPMTTATTTGAPARPTRRIPRWFLRVPELFFRLRLGRFVPWWVMIVTTGRRSGKPRSVVLDVVRRDGRGLWVIAADGLEARWVKNLLADPSCTVVHGGRRFAAHAVVAAMDAGDLVAEIYRQRPTYLKLVYLAIGQRIRSLADARRLAAGTVPVCLEEITG